MLLIIASTTPRAVQVNPRPPIRPSSHIQELARPHNSLIPPPLPTTAPTLFPPSAIAAMVNGLRALASAPTLSTTVKPNTPPSAVAAMVNGLRALSSAPGVLFLAVGSALPLPPALAASTPASPWTHALLGRYESRDALQAYGASAEHVKVVEGCIKPIISDILAVDWETDVNASADANASCLPFSVIHSVVMELTPPTDAVAIPTMVSSLKAHVGEIPGLTEVSIGENIAPARAKGFTWGFASYHADEAALRAYAGDERHRQVMAQTVLPLVARFNWRGDERHRQVMAEAVLPLVARFNWVDFRVDEAFGEARTRL
ncbi:unnamed protein product [Closterium sp. Naga37s-1]|nr:unnamed protein product [Closterium sp. Naga37s-1]